MLTTHASIGERRDSLAFALATARPSRPISPREQCTASSEPLAREGFGLHLCPARCDGRRRYAERVAYTDATGVSHVLVLDGDDVNAPGKKRAEVWFY